MKKYASDKAVSLRVTFRKLIELLDAREKARALLLLGMILTMGVIEIVGVASIMPFVAVLSNPGVVTSNRYLAFAYEWLGFETPERFLFFLGIFVLALVIGSTGFKALTTWAILRFTAMRNYSLSRRLFARYMQRPYEWFLGKHSADLGKNILQETSNVVSGAMLPALQLISQGVVILFIGAMLIVVDPVLALTIAFFMGGAYGLIFWRSRRHIRRIGEERVRANRERYRVSSEAFGGFKEAKVLGLEPVLLRRFEKPSLRLASHTASHQIIAQLPQYALQAIAFGGILLVVQYQLLTQKDLTQSLPFIALYAVAGYRLLPALQQFYASLSQLRFAGAVLDVLHKELTELPLPTSEPTEDTSRLPPLTRGLELREVSYRYPASTSLALERVNVTIPVRSTIGLVGETGAGKSTAVDVILGLLNPEAGKLLVDGVAITDENKRAWQRNLGYVPQHIFLIDDTIAANIAMGATRSELDMVAVERAARLANLHAFVTEELEKGYETLIGDRGIRLSGGERQRVGIARALYRDPDVVIMDEATSALDNVTERAVMDAVHTLGCQKTLILIAHRLTTVKRSDKIYVFKRGRVVASGTYDELVRGNEHFRAMVDSALG